MNYLAHLFLAADTPASMTGNLMADFVKGDAMLTLPTDVQAGVRQHRAVDRFTDTHPVIKESHNRLGQRWARTAGIVIDVYYDHLLARNWADYSQVTLRAYLDRAYDQMQPLGAQLPERFRVELMRLVETDLLMGYTEEAGVERALSGLSHRLRNGQFQLEKALDDLRREDAMLEADFRRFWPEAIAFAQLLS